MPVSIIPFKMPDPAEIPSHIVEHLQQMDPDAAVRQGMELLLQIEAAQTLVYERVNADGAVELGAVAGSDQQKAAALHDALAAAPGYGQALDDEATLSGRALGQGSALLIMGQTAAGEADGLPAVLRSHMLEGGTEGNIGFNYALPFSDERPLGGLILLRPAAEGPLNHEQPNLTEALRRVLNGVLAAA